jgi:hypothetical protein
MTTNMNRTSIFLLDRDKTRSEHLSRFNGRVCVTVEDIVEATSQANIYSVWISCVPEMTDTFLLATHRIRPVSKLNRALGNYLMLQPPSRAAALFSLDGMFSRVAGGQLGGFLPLEELIEVLAAPATESQDRFLGGMVDLVSQNLALVRGNFKPVTVPLSMFQPTDTGVVPDPSRFAVSDYGHVIHLGDYEIAADAILYEVDPHFRRRVNALRRSEEQGFGASLRRLRIARGLRQSDFPPISSKTIARIERGEIDKPHCETLEVLSSRLGVSPDSIETY